MTTGCLIPNLVLYFLASLCYLILPFQKDVASPFARIGFTFTLMGLLLHGIYLGFWIVQEQFFPLAMISFGIVGLFVGMVWRKVWHGFGTLFVPLGFIFLLLSLSPATKAYWLNSLSPLTLGHVGLAGAASFFMFGNLGFGLAFVLQERNLKQKKWENLFWYLPPLLTNERLALAWLRIGFFLLTMVLISGAFLVGEVTRIHWMHVGLALIAWVFYLLLLERRFGGGRRGQKILLLSLLGFVSLAAAYLWT